jgi:ElaB/YqjD/DUF883 family membrane-anchored ribosome-binding protein
MPDLDLDDPRELQRDMARRREDLAATLDALQDKVREKIDVRARARVMVARGRQTGREHPTRVIAIAAGAVALLVAMMLLRRRAHA